MRTRYKRVEVRCNDDVSKLLAIFAERVNETKTEFIERAIIERCMALSGVDHLKHEEAATNVKIIEAAISKPLLLT